MDKSLERIAFDMISELGITKWENKGTHSFENGAKEIDRVLKLYEYALEKIKKASHHTQQE